MWVQLALSAVHSTGLKIKGTEAWSPIFAHEGAICQYWNQRLRIFRVTDTFNTKNLNIPTKYTPPKVTSKE